MLRSIFGFNWRNSSAHLLFLSKFLSARTMDDFVRSDTWREVLREAPEKAAQRFLDEGLLEQAGLSGLLNHRYKASELKPMLRERGLPVSGRKAELVERLIQADPEGMRRATRGVNVLQCSERGQVAAQEYLAREKATRARAEERVMQALRRHRFKEASRVVSVYEAEQVFPRGIGIDWRDHDSAQDVAMLRAMFQASPKILSSMNREQMRHLRLAAGMMHLWGANRPRDWLPSDFQMGGLGMDDEAAARMVLSHASYQLEIARYRKMGVRTVRTLTANDPLVCGACRRLATEAYELNRMPELPYAKCTSEVGCRCAPTVADF